jgi:hypothetical protein
MPREGPDAPNPCDGPARQRLETVVERLPLLAERAMQTRTAANIHPHHMALIRRPKAASRCSGVRGFFCFIPSSADRL